jgi:hypothetical protein
MLFLNMVCLTVAAPKVNCPQIGPEVRALSQIFYRPHRTAEEDFCFKLMLEAIDKLLEVEEEMESSEGEFHDQADDEWIVIRGPLRGHNDTPFGRPTPGRPIGRLGVVHPQGIFGVFSYY